MKNIFLLIKNYFLSASFHKKTFLFLFFLNFLFFLLFIPKSSGAVEAIDKAINFIKNLPFAIPGGIAWLIGFIAVSVLALGITFVQWVTGPSFTTLSYTNPKGNPGIEIGLSITQGLTNMFLVLILVFIAIATILRLEKYSTKALLAKFVLIALLVNFSPVICGLIVDAANIVTNFFLSAVKPGAGIDIMWNLGSDISFHLFDPDPRYLQQAVFETLARATMYFIMAFVYFAFGLIFMLRYVVIWVLVILSPIAFACYIIPDTRKYWTQWWHHFFQWSFIGVTCGFFIYLSEKFMEIWRAGTYSSQLSGFAVLQQLMLPVATLVIGLIFGLTTGAAGASAIMDFAKTRMKTTAKGLGKITGKGFYRAGRVTGRKLRTTAIPKKEKIQRWAEQLATSKKWGEGEPGWKGRAKRMLATFSPYRHAKRGLGLALTKGITSTKKQEIDRGATAVKGKTPAEMLSKFRRTTSKLAKIGILEKAIEEGKISDLMDEEKVGKNALNTNEVTKLIKKAKEWGVDKKLKKAFPHLAEDFVSDEEFAKAKTLNPKIQNKEAVIVSEMKPEDYKNLPKQALKNEKFIDAMLLLASGKDISNFIEKFGRKASKKIEDRIRINTWKAGKQYHQRGGTFKWLKENNPYLHNYLRSTPGKALINFPESFKHLP